MTRQHHRVSTGRRPAFDAFVSVFAATGHPLGEGLRVRVSLAPLTRTEASYVEGHFAWQHDVARLRDGRLLEIGDDGREVWVHPAVTPPPRVVRGKGQRRSRR